MPTGNDMLMITNNPFAASAAARTASH